MWRKELNVEKLTAGEQSVLDAIVVFIETHNYSPTVRDLCSLTEYSSTSTIAEKLKSLKRKGYIDTVDRGKRTIKLITPLYEMVPVVRCKNCMHRRGDWCEILGLESPTEEGYCCYGDVGYLNE
jgi:DNA-binding MarR family transcriptional regulator